MAGEEESSPWRVVSARTAFENPWLKLIDHEVLTPTGAAGRYGVVSFKNIAIGVLPLHPDGTVTLVGQYRFALGAYSWELPEGGGDLSAPPLESAKRELKEETGLTARTWREFMRFNTSNSVTDELAVCFIATDLTDGEPEPDEDEILRVERRPFAETLDRVTSGEIMDSLTVAMMLRAHHMAVTGDIDRELARAMLG
ncbi:MAG: NUDIX hydrolase [Caulobacterales bacterium]|nr:NUDIX hydrolase [Caulobacterales bacterium]